MSIQLVLNALKTLKSDDYRVLNAIELGMRRHEFVPVDWIARFVDADIERVEGNLRRLNKLGLVQRCLGNYTGYVLTFRGYDCLALHVFKKRNLVKGIGLTPIGVGKEADVYPAVTPGGRKIVLKFHRAGRTSFRRTRRTRAYVGDRHHISWLYQSRLAAKSEYEALSILFPRRVRVPQPIDWNRHVVAVEYVDGVELFKAPLRDPEHVMNAILQNLMLSWRAGVVHGDLSEYNILIVGEADPVLFDWPQWIPSSHPMASFYLRRDVVNILKFFKRKYGLSLDPEKLADKLLLEWNTP